MAGRLKYPGASGSAPVDSIRVGERARSHLGDIDQLAASIAEVGLLHPIVIDGESNLIAGERRLEAVKRLGWAEVEVTVKDRLDTALRRMIAERDENLYRKPFTPVERVRVATRLEQLEAVEAKRRQQIGGRRGGQGSGKLPEAEKGQTRDKVAEAVGTSARTLDKAKAVVAAAEDESLPPEVREVAAEAMAEMEATGKVDGAYRKVREALDADQADEIADAAELEVTADETADGAELEAAPGELEGEAGLDADDPYREVLAAAEAETENVDEPEPDGPQPVDQAGVEPGEVSAASPAAPADDAPAPTAEAAGGEAAGEQVTPPPAPAAAPSTAPTLGDILDGRDDELVEPGPDEVLALAALTSAVEAVERLERIDRLGPFNALLSRLSQKCTDAMTQRAAERRAAREAAEREAAS